MIDSNKLDNVYDKGIGPGDPVTVKDFKPNINPERNKTSPIQHTTSLDPTQYQNIPGGVYDYQDVNTLRGEAQSAWDKWGNMLAGIIPKIGTTFLEGVGYLGALATEGGDDRDYSNSLTEWSKEATQSIDEALPMYRKNNDTFGLTDAAWWTQNIQGLAVSAASFALAGAGFVKMFSMLGKGAKAINMGRKGIGLVNKGTEVLTSGMLAYTEGAMVGKDVYDKTYDTQLKNNLRAGKSFQEAHELARHIAAQSAATTVQLNTMINTGLNLEAVSGLFGHRNEALIEKFWRKEGRQLGGETFEDFANRIRTGTSLGDKKIASQIFKHEGLRHYGISAVSEGVEELTNLFTQRTGESLGQQWDDKKKTGRALGMFEQLGEVSHYFERTMDKEGALSFMLGAVGGVAQSGLIDNAIPMHKVTKLDKTTGEAIETGEKDATGNKKYEQEWVTARSKGKYHDRLYFKNVRDAIVSDIGRFDDLKSKIAQARSAGNHDRADSLSEEVLNAMNYNAVHMGMASNYEQTFREIANTDNTTVERDALIPQIEQLNTQLATLPDGADKIAVQTQRDELQAKFDKMPATTTAVQKGYAKDGTDNEYKTKAEAAIADLKELERIHEKVQEKYGRENNPAVQRVADMVSNRRMTLYSQNNRIRKLETKLAQLEGEQNTMIDAASDVTGVNSEIARYNAAVQVASEMKARYASQIQVLDKAITTLGTDPENTTARAVVDNLVRKYSIIGMTGLKNEGALQELADTLVRRHEAADTRVKEEQDKLFNTTGYSKWGEKNPTGKFEDFIESVGKKHQVSKKHLLLSTYLQEQKDEHAEGTARLLELESETGLKSMIKKSEALYKELNKQSELAKEKAMAEKERRRNQFIATEEELLRTKNKLQEQYRQELVALQAEQVKLVTGISETGAELVTYASNNGVVHLTTLQAVQKWHALIAKKSGMEDRLAKVEARIIYLQTLYANLESEITKGNTALEAIQNNKEETGIANNDVDVTATSETATQAEVVTLEQKAEQTPAALRDVESTAKALVIAFKKDGVVDEDGYEFRNEKNVFPVFETFTKEMDDRYQEEVFNEELKTAEQFVSEEYHKAKADGSNPELVKAVESLLSKDSATQTEPTGSTNWAMVVEQAAKDYLFKLKLVPNIIQRKVVAYEQLLKDGTETFSFSFLKEEIKNNQISLLDAGQVLAALKEYTEAVLNLQDSTQVETEDNAAKLTMNEETIGKLEENFIEDSDGDDSGLIGPPGSLELVSTSLEETPSHEGAKVENVIKINTLALDYAEFFDPQTNSYKRFSLVDKLNENANPNMIKRGGVKVGQKILLSVDTKFVGTINHDTDMVNDEYGYRDKGISKSSKDYLTVDGKVTEEHIEEVPIKITDDQGNILGWLPRVGWVTAKYPGTAGDEEYANVQKNVTDSEGNVHDNIEKQKAELMAVRKAIVEAHNSGKQSVPTVVVAISAGTVIHNKVVNLNTETSKMTWDTASKLLPNTSLKLAIVTNGTVYSAEGKESTENISLGNSRRYKQYKNLPVVLLPAYNGEVVVAPLLSRPLFSETGSQSDFNTIVRAIELFIGSKSDSTETKAAFKSEIAAVLEATEIDISTEDGLRTFINQFFTYTHDHFNDSVIAKTKSPTGKTVMKFLFKIENALEGQTHGSIKIGTTYSGKHPMHASLVNGKLHPDFVAALKAGIGGRYKNVNFEKRDKIDGSRVTIKGINTPGKFISPMFRTNGVWVFKEHDNYNEYVKANTKTNVVGTNEIDGEYFYTVHPQVQLDVKKILGEPKVEIVSTSLPDPSGLKSEDSSALSLLDSLLNSKLKEPVISIVNSTGQVEDKHNIPVSVASVTERYNFTLPEHRNGKSVNEVLADLQRLGIPYLTDGYNPFSKCM